jgi:uncharacterized protein
MKIAYLHGLLHTSTTKTDWLSKNHDVFTPTILYSTPEVFELTIRNVKKFNPDLIIGSSMGGYFAIEIGKRLNIPVIGLNPAVHNTGVNINIPPNNETEYNPLMYMGYGINDNVIDYKKSIDILDGIPFKLGLHTHRTPLEFFKETFNTLVNSPKFQNGLHS